MMPRTTAFGLVGVILTIALFTLACKYEQNNPIGQFSTLIPNDAMRIQESSFTPLTFKTGLDNTRFFPDATGSTGYLYAEAKAAEAPVTNSKRVPLNIALVIDRSGSMQGNKLSYAKQAARYVIDQLSSDDFVSIVQYDDEVQVVAKATSVTDKQGLKHKIDMIQAGGYTNLSGGMTEGYTQVKSAFREGAVNRVLLLSDGLANVGITDVSRLQRIAKDYNLNHGLTVSTFGLGLDYNETLMTNIAENGSGNYYFIQQPEQIPAIFQRELSGLLNVVAQNATLSIDLPVGMQLLKVFGYQYIQEGQRITVNFRDVMAGETKSVLVKFAVNPGAPQYTLQSSLSFDNPFAAEGSPKRMRLDASDKLLLASNAEEFGQNFVAAIQSQVVLFESNDRLEEAMRDVDAGNFEAAREKVKANEVYLSGNIELVQASPELQVQVANNAGYQTQISNVESLDASSINVIQKASKASNYDVRKKRSPNL